jgi:hypothetical protein
MSDFASALRYGRAGESLIAEWFKRRGYCVLPAYEKIISEGKGPQLYMANGKALIAPDLLVFSARNVLWIEAKHKTAFTWHRITGRWVTGIDLKHYEDYCKVADGTPWPVWLLFLHEGGMAKDSPADSPAGLFGESLAHLRQHENHRHGNWGRGGMAYWSDGTLRRLATLDEMRLTLGA